MFDPFDLEKARRVFGEDLDALPFGVIVVDRTGKIIEYNTYEREMAAMDGRDVVGLNFFHDVAPCTAIAEFEGRFGDFLEGSEDSIAPFEFIFPFNRGPQKVNVIFLRTARGADRATICVIRSAAPPNGSA